MRIARTLLLLTGGLVLLVSIWLWWNRYQRVDMAAYVPAETLVYLEANSLSDITSAVTSTDAWKALSVPAGIRPDLGKLGWVALAVGRESCRRCVCFHARRWRSLCWALSPWQEKS